MFRTLWLVVLAGLLLFVDGCLFAVRCCEVWGAPELDFNGSRFQGACSSRTLSAVMRMASDNRKSIKAQTYLYISCGSLSNGEHELISLFSLAFSLSRAHLRVTNLTIICKPRQHHGTLAAVSKESFDQKKLGKHRKKGSRRHVAPRLGCCCFRDCCLSLHTNPQ